MKNLTDKKLELLDAMLDDRIEMYGVINTIQYLLDNDFTKEELLEMKFDEVDINEAIEDDMEDLEKFKLIHEWFKEYEGLEFNSNDEIFKHFLNLHYEDDED